MVIAYHMVQRGIEKGRQEGLAEGIAIGHDKGRAEGHNEGRGEGRDEAYKDAARQNQAYYKRMRRALDAGEDFNEPPPTFGNNRR